LSILDPELIELAKKTVAEGKKTQLETALVCAVDNGDLATIAAVMEQVKMMRLQINFQVAMVAESLTRNYNLNKVKLSLKEAILSTPKAQLEVPIRKCEGYYMDPQNPLLQKLVSLTQMSELTVAISRVQDFVSGASSCMAFSAFGSPMFRRVYNFLNRFDMKRFSAQDRRLLISVILQFCGTALMSSYLMGDSLPNLTRLIKHGLTCCSHFHVETEPMQLARLSVGLCSRSLGGDIGEAELVVRGENRQDFSVFAEDNSICGQPNPIYAVDKYNLLNLATENVTGGLLSTFMRRPSLTHTAKGHSDAVALVSFTATSITKSLLRFQSAGSKDKQNSDGVSQSEVCRLFEALQVVMGDKALSTIESNKSAIKASLITGKHTDVVEVAMELISAGIKITSLADELYLHVCKQLSGNPNPRSTEQGWKIMSLYLHYFAPSEHFLPYLQNYIRTALKKCIFGRRLIQLPLASGVHAEVTDPQHEDYENIDDGLIIYNLLNYCIQLLAVIEMSYRTAKNSTSQQPASLTPLNSTSNAGSSFVPKKLHRRDVEFVLVPKTSTFVEVILMTGSKYRMSCQYGELTNPVSLALQTYLRYTGLSFSQLFDALRRKKAHICADSEACDSTLLRSFTTSLFRGFGVYFHTNVDPDDEGEVVDVDTEVVSDMQRIPVQPEERQFIDYKYDLVWDIMTVAKEVRQEKTSTGHSGEYSEHDQDGNLEKLDSEVFPAGTFIIRRRVGVPSEKFASHFELFGDDVAVRDIHSLQCLWEAWLCKSHAHVPFDYGRIDLHFAEDCRYVNSGLYGSTSCRLFLLALQLSLGWEDEASDEWGEGHSAVLSGCDLSVRPIYKFPIVGDSADGLDGSVHGGDLGTTRQSLAAEQFRKSVYQHIQRGSVSAAEEGSHLTAPSSGHASDDDNSELHLRNSNNSVEDDDVVSLYSSVDYDEHTEPDEDQRFYRQPIRSYQSLRECDIAEIILKIKHFGFEEYDDEAVVKQVIDTVAQIHQLAIELSIPTSSPRFRYFLKRAYVEYVHSLPLFASHFSSGRIMHAVLMESAEQVSHSAPVPLPEVPLGSDVLITLNCCGIQLLDPSDWSVLFQAPLFDVEGVSSAPIATANDADDAVFDSSKLF
jgi:hypothetical protein